jgi:DNA-binding MarR family transcriptional regulator
MPLRLIPDLHRATHRVGLRLEAEGRPAVSQAEAHILAHLAPRGQGTVAELHAALAHRRSTLTSVLDRLEGAGLVTRGPSASDRRSVEVRLTAPGKRAAAAVHRRLAGIEKRALAGRSPRAVRDLLAVLEALGR